MFTVPQAKSIPPSILEFVIQHFLRVVDSTETPEILPKLVEAMRSLATTHKNIFLPHFKRAFDLIIGWCMDPVTPRSLSQPLEGRWYNMWRDRLAEWPVLNSSTTSPFLHAFLETLKKMYSFLRQDGNMGFCMEILSSIIDDIEKCADVACFKCVSSSTNDNPHIAHSVPPPRLNDRCSETRATEKMPADVFVFFNCAISLFYALFAALPSDTSAASIAKTLSSTSSSSSAFTSSFSSSSSNSFPSLDDRLKLESLTIWMLEIIVHIGLKYEDRRWISLGKQFLACIHKFKRLHTMVAAQTASSTSSLSTLIFQYIVRFHEFELAWSLEDDGFSKTEKSILDILKSGNGHAFEGDEDLFKDAQKWICHVKDTLGIWGLNSNILVSVDKNTSPSTGTTTSIPQHNPLDTLRINLSLSIAPLFINPFIKSGILLLIRRDLMASYCCNFNGFNASFECEYLDLVLTILSGLPSTSMSRMAAGSINADLGVWSLFQEIIEIIIFISQQKLGSSITTPSFSNMLASIESRSLAFDSSSSNTSNSIETTTGSTSTTTSAAAPHQPSIELLKSIIVFNIRLIKECSKFNILMNTTENKNVPINVIVGKILSELLLCMSSSALSPVSSVSSLSVDSDWRSLQDVLLSEMLAMCSRYEGREISKIKDEGAKKLIFFSTLASTFSFSPTTLFHHQPIPKIH